MPKWTRSGYADGGVSPQTMVCKICKRQSRRLICRACKKRKK